MLEKYAEVMLLICLNGKQMGTAWFVSVLHFSFNSTLS